MVEDATYVFSLEPTLLRLKSPTKIFGDIHGQFDDLMRLFEEYGMPVIAGDLVLTDYLFLGDYVDRGAWNLGAWDFFSTFFFPRMGNLCTFKGHKIL